MVTIIDLSLLAVVLGRHLGLEEGNRRPVQIELSCNSLLFSRRLVSQLFDVLLSLDLHVNTAGHGLGSSNLTVGVVKLRTVRLRLKHNKTKTLHNGEGGNEKSSSCPSHLPSTSI